MGRMLTLLVFTEVLQQFTQGYPRFNGGQLLVTEYLLLRKKYIIGDENILWEIAILLTWYRVLLTHGERPKIRRRLIYAS